MKNRIILGVLFIFLCNNVLAQNATKNTMRTGAGIMIREGANGEKYKTGAAIEAEYQYSTSKYIGFTASLGMMNIHYGQDNVFQETFATFGAIVTPLPDKFRWLKIGAGLSLQHVTDAFGFWTYYIDDSNPNNVVRIDYYGYYRYSRSRGGIDFVGRLYFIDTPKYELFTSYRLKTNFDSGLEMDNALLSLCFGVKF